MKQVRGYLERKGMLYKTGVEYGDYTINHVQGCSHGCKYPCYAFLLKKRFGQIKNYEEWIQPYLISNTLELLDKEIPRLKEKIQSVQLCFSTDPFMYEYDEIKNMSLKVIEKLNKFDIPCSILTKGVLPVRLAEYSKKNTYGITIVTLDEEFRKKIEPNAAPIRQRLEALEKLSKKGCKTWVSIEPYPTPNIWEQDLLKILNSIQFVDRIVFGRMNYNKEVSSFKDYKDFFNDKAKTVISFCKKHKIDYHIKDGTLSK